MYSRFASKTKLVGDTPPVDDTFFLSMTGGLVLLGIYKFFFNLQNKSSLAPNIPVHFGDNVQAAVPGHPGPGLCQSKRPLFPLLIYQFKPGAYLLRRLFRLPINICPAGADA
jgi:hypothetical protein